jgi:hypothetical protein
MCSGTSRARVRTQYSHCWVLGHSSLLYIDMDFSFPTHDKTHDYSTTLVHVILAPTLPTLATHLIQSNHQSPSSLLDSSRARCFAPQHFSWVAEAFPIWTRPNSVRLCGSFFSPRAILEFCCGWDSGMSVMVTLLLSRA